MSPRYAEPTAAQAEEAAALLFLAQTQKALRTNEHLWDLRLELDVSYTIHNQHTYRVHATTRTGENVTGDKGYYVHPVNGTPDTAAWHIAAHARAAAAKRRQAAAEAPAAPTPAAPRSKSA